MADTSVPQDQRPVWSPGAQLDDLAGSVLGGIGNQIAGGWAGLKAANNAMPWSSAVQHPLDTWDAGMQAAGNAVDSTKPFDTSIKPDTARSVQAAKDALINAYDTKKRYDPALMLADAAAHGIASTHPIDKATAALGKIDPRVAGVAGAAMNLAPALIPIPGVGSMTGTLKRGAESFADATKGYASDLAQLPHDIAGGSRSYMVPPTEPTIQPVVVPGAEKLAQPGEAESIANKINTPDASGGRGISYHPSTGNQPTSGHAVSVYKERESKVPGEVTPEQVQTYIADNSDIFAKDPTAHFGAWHNPDDGFTYLDVSGVHPSRTKAISLAHKNNQEGIFDLGTKETTYLKDLPPEQIAAAHLLNDPHEGDPLLHLSNTLYGDVPAAKKGSQTTASLASRFMDEGQDVWGDRDMSENTPENVNDLAIILAKEGEAVLQRDPHHGKWYENMVDEAHSVANLMHPGDLDGPYGAHHLNFPLAISSNGTSPQSQGAFALQQWRDKLETGRYPEIGIGDKSGPMANSFKLYNDLADEMGEDNLIKFMHTDFTVGQLQAAGFPVSGENLTETVPGSIIFGPKIGAGFYQNLEGNFNQVTSDRWHIRLMGRLKGILNKISPEGLEAQKQRLIESLFGTGVAPRDADALQAATAKLKPDADLEDPNTLQKIAKGLNAFYGKNRPASERAMDNLAIGKVSKKTGLPSGGYSDEYASEATRAGKNYTQSFSKAKEAPGGGGERLYDRRVMRRATQILQDAGYDISPAGLQATVWNPEVELYNKLGYRGKGEENRDYASVFKAEARSRGFTDDQIADAINSRAVAGGGPSRDLGASPQGPQAGRSRSVGLAPDEATAALWARADKSPDANVKLLAKKIGPRPVPPAPGDPRQALIDRWMNAGPAVAPTGAAPTPMVHATTADFDEYDPTRSEGFIHAGPPSTSNVRVEDMAGARSLPMLGRVNNPVRLEDRVGGWQPEVMANQLLKNGTLSRDEYNFITEPRTTASNIYEGDDLMRKRLIGTLEARGFDSGTYMNRYEGIQDADWEKALGPKPTNNAQLAEWVKQKDILRRMSSDEEFKQKVPGAPESYLFWDPRGLKSRFSEGFDPNDKRFTKAKGGLVRKYADGGPVVSGQLPDVTVTAPAPQPSVPDPVPGMPVAPDPKYGTKVVMMFGRPVTVSADPRVEARANAAMQRLTQQDLVDAIRRQKGLSAPASQYGSMTARRASPAWLQQAGPGSP